MALIYAGNKLNKDSLIEKGFSKDFIEKGFIKYYIPLLGCANKDLDGFFGLLCKFIEYCRIVALLPVIHYTQRNNW